jgi:uncharacterized iron-regulated membrane protein
MANSLWPKSSSERVDSALSAHSVMGLVISALLFVICVSGTIAVFEDELEWWEQAGTPTVQDVSPSVMQATAEEVLKRDPGTTHLYLYPPRNNWPRFVAGGDNGMFVLDESGVFVRPLVAPWNDFLIELHYYLTLPHSVGLIIVALFGVMLVSMAISGLLAHPRIFRDAFRFRRTGQARLAQADLHNRLSVWTTPFLVAVAGTGAMIGLFGVIAFVFAQTNFGGDIKSLSEAIFGGEIVEADSTPAPLIGVDTALINLNHDVADANPFIVIIHEPGTKSQHIEIYGDETDRLIYGETYTYSTEGELLAKGHNSDGPVGQQVAMSMYRLHFGDFGGALMKSIYFVLGIMLCIVVATGLNIYFLKRREKGRAAPRLEALWSGWVWGSTAMFPITLMVSLLGVSGGWLIGLFWIGSVAFAAAATIWMSAASAGRVFRTVFGVALLAAPLLHLMRGDASWSNAYAVTASAIMFVAGALFVAKVLMSSRRVPGAAVAASRGG